MTEPPKAPKATAIESPIYVKDQFEQWAKTAFKYPFDLRQNHRGVYRNSTVRYCWLAWNAALEQHG